MGFLRRDDDDEPKQQPAPVETAEVAEAPHAAAYEAGSLAGIPESGSERIERMKKEVDRGFFTSDLSINEFLLVKQAGFDPLGLVLGSSIYHIGFQQANWSRNQEMGVLTQAMYHARELAMTRMEEEADQLGADGVVGVRLDIGRYEWGADLAEFIAIGTAVKHRGGELHRAPNGRPFTSDLSGQDFSTLLRSGYRPVGLVMGNCVYHVAHQGLRAVAAADRAKPGGADLHPGAVRGARAGDGAHADRGLRGCRPSGIVGAQIIERSHGWGSHVIEFFAIGTGVVPISDEHVIEQPTLVLPLTG